ncbi:unnamed protein product (macronuclear) [Paramecium tetraurelia]|uniref:VLIG-type G domain-containing protein n=1 Tax=Paramecium tetraurelia TaxID=5888 RepID=A0CJX0_PARTE|nr:uncharacterized protein GSPATT00000799001 [Paramecium tetraurelia]CAK71087.1 unnamed protein product [Paramecium tetraurelia]|eukprot:XP_001438484.1 hypothetical protein (macronuclear) [Paramecium tetraurelia strain d4-2]
MCIELNTQSKQRIQGIFGCQSNIERKIQNDFKKVIDLAELLYQSEKGNLIVIKFSDLLLFCLILSNSFFTKIPIQEQSIEIVLFRILQDFTDNIIICLDELVFSNWYNGNAIPFSSEQLVRQDFDFKELNKQEIQRYQCQYSRLENDIKNWQIIKSYSIIPQIYIIKRLEQIKIEDLQNTFKSFTQTLLIQIISKNNHSIVPLINILKKEHQTDKIRTLINELSIQLNEEVQQQRKKLIQKICNQLQPWYSKFHYDDTKLPIAEEIVSSIFQSVEFIENQQLTFKFQNSQDNKKYEKYFNEHKKIINLKFKEIQGEFIKKIDELYQELCQQVLYSVKKINFRCYRNKSQNIDNIKPELDEIYDYYLDGSFLQDRKQDYHIKEIFQTKNKSSIFIVYTQKMAYILFLLFQAQKAILYTISTITLDHLFIFNHKEKYVQQITISSRGIVQNDQFYCYQLDNQGNPFLVDQVAYIYTCKKLIVLSKNNKIYTQSEKEQQFRLIKCLQEIGNEVTQTEFTPSTNPTQNYKQLLACPSGKYFYLANFHCCDRYDLTGKKLQTIPINGHVKIMYEFQNEGKKYVLKIQSNLSQQRQEQKSKLLGNPALDIVKGSESKFGPNAEFLYQNKLSYITLYVKENEQLKMMDYFKKLDLKFTNLSMNDSQYSECDRNQIIDIIFSRVPLQFCTIEYGTLIPLNDGFRQFSLNQKSISIDCRVKQLHLGFLEDYLLVEEKKIFVVGIIGRQSSGKSYLLNRVFGTRFSVSSARCTDGVWGSLAIVDNQKFLILDCEGLFDGSRTEKEEVKMLSFIIAISDATILNSDTSFDRHQKELFNNVFEESQQLKDERLFKGFLYKIIRDVNSFNALDNEQIRDFPFLKELFSNYMSVEQLVNNEKELFDHQLKKIRAYLLQKSIECIRWKNGKELISMVKVVLCQLELSDTKDATLIDFEIRLEQIYSESKSQWYKFTLDQQQQGEELRLNQRKYQFEMDDFDYIKYNHVLLKSLYNDLQLKDNINDHKSNLLEANNQLKKLMEQRKKQIIQKTQSEIENINGMELQAKIEVENSKLEDFFKIQFDRYQFCQNKCNECFLPCKYFNNHIEHFESLKKKLENEIDMLEQQRNNSSIQNQKEEMMERNSLISISQKIEEIGINLFLLSNLIKLATMQEQKEQLMNIVQEFSFFNVQRVQQNGMNLESENENMQIAFDIKFINDEQRKTKNELKTQGDKLIKIIQEKEEVQQKYSDLKYQCNQIELQIQIQIDKNNQQIGSLNSEKSKISEEIIKIENEILQLGGYYKENEKNQNDNKIKELKEKLHDLREGIKFFQQSKNENQRLLEQYTNMPQQLFLQVYQQKLDKNKELYDNLRKIKEKKSYLNKNKTKITELNEEIEELSLARYRNRIMIEDLRQELSQPQFQNIENQLEYCNKEELQLKEQIDALYFSKINLFEQCMEKQVGQEEQVESFNIKDNFLLSIQSEITYYENEIKRLSQEIEIVNQEISESQIIVDRQTKLNYLQEKKLIKVNQHINLETQINQLKKSSIDQSENLIALKDQSLKEQQELNSLKEYENNLINKEQEKQEQITKIDKYLKELRDLEQHLKEKQVLDQEMQKFETLLKGWEGRDNYTNLKLKDLQQEYQKMEEKKQVLLIQQQNKKRILECYQKVETSAEKLDSLKYNLLELVELNSHVHSCLSDHKCDQICKVCPNKKCENKAGHNESQYHLCSLKNHKCNIKCSITQCQVKCNLELNHTEQHNCTNVHLCGETCQYCSKKCKTDRTTKHQNHICEESYCIQNCVLCERRCKNNHEHSQYRNSQNQNHFCGDQHECQEFCQEKGICQITYTQVEIMWQSRFSYIKYIPQSNEKKKCCRNIKPQQLNHNQIHSCMIETEKQFHLCDQKCPECNKICDLKYGHSGHHSSQIHINKEFQIFTIKQGEEFKLIIQDQNNNVARQYQIGEQSTPETCDQSCRRRGKSHYHLIECKGESQCLEKQIGIRARHSKEKYEGFQHLNFDEVLCIDYWDYKGWAHPIPKETQNIGLCNYYCPICKKINGEYQFCCQQAWHSQDNKISSHKFPCSSTHKVQFIQGINIAFVIDTTGSMSQYIDNCKEVIKSIMQKTKENHNIEMKFAIVSYKDHQNPYDELQNVVNICQFTSYSLAISFLNSLSAEGGDDEPEAVLDGLDASLELNWNGNYQNLLYLIAEAPPHGKQYHNFGDSFPDGCPCKKTQGQIFYYIRNKKIQVKVMKLNQKIEGMITQFKEDYPDLMVIAPDDDQDITFQNLIVADVCEYLKPNEITYQML